MTSTATSRRTASLGQTYTNTYDEGGNLLTRQAYNPDLFYTESYTYDDHGNVTHYDTDKPLESGNVTDWTYTYDDQGPHNQQDRRFDRRYSGGHLYLHVYRRRTTPR